METLDFSKLTAEGLLDRLPDEETTRWEFKAGEFLSKAKRGEFKTELGKQVSAFANSGGGFLVVGVSKDRKLAPTDQLTEGRQTLTDWLSQRTEQCVDPWIRDFHVHKLPLADDPTKAVYVVEVGDSVSAPHQAKDDLTYYYRIPGHSKPAPHFHLELLRNRMTKSMLAIESGYIFHIENDERRWPKVEVHLSVKNLSIQCAERWGVLVSCPSAIHNTFRCEGQPIWSGEFVYGESIATSYKKQVLMPSETVRIRLRFSLNERRQNTATIQNIERDWRPFGVFVRPVSHNCFGESMSIGWFDDDSDWESHRFMFEESFHGRTTTPP